MKVPGIEEMFKTFEANRRRFAHLGVDAAQRAGLLAVFETHVRNMLADCRAEAIADVARQIHTKPMPVIDSPETYADRILSQLKEPRHD